MIECNTRADTRDLANLLPTEYYFFRRSTNICRCGTKPDSSNSRSHSFLGGCVMVDLARSITNGYMASGILWDLLVQISTGLPCFGMRARNWHWAERTLPSFWALPCPSIRFRLCCIVCPLHFFLFLATSIAIELAICHTGKDVRTG